MTTCQNLIRIEIHYYCCFIANVFLNTDCLSFFIPSVTYFFSPCRLFHQGQIYFSYIHVNAFSTWIFIDRKIKYIYYLATYASVPSTLASFLSKVSPWYVTAWAGKVGIIKVFFLSTSIYSSKSKYIKNLYSAEYFFLLTRNVCKIQLDDFKKRSLAF